MVKFDVYYITIWYILISRIERLSYLIDYTRPLQKSFYTQKLLLVINELYL